MPPELTTRPVPAPAADWLTEADVLKLLNDISSETLRRMMRKGRFPRPTLWGRDAKWRWEAVAWFYLGKLLSPSLMLPDGDDDDGPDETTTGQQPDDNPATKPRQPRNNPRQPAAGD